MGTRIFRIALHRAALWGGGVLTLASLMGCPATVQLRGTEFDSDTRVRESRAAEVKSLVDAATRNPVAACDQVLSKALASDRFGAGQGESWRYDERAWLERVQRWACKCKGTLFAQSETPPLSLEALPSESLDRLVGALNSFNQTPEVQTEALRLLKARVPTATLAEIADLYVGGVDAVLGTGRNRTPKHKREYVACWERPGWNSVPMYSQYFHETDLQDQIWKRADVVAKEEHARRARIEQQERDQRKAEELARRRQTPEYWGAEIRNRLWNMTAAVNHASSLTQRGYGTRALEEAWPEARLRERELCALVAEMKATAPQVANDAKDLVVRSISYAEGDGPAASARQLLEPYLRGQCGLLGH
jgi:hypothetical protein